MADTIKAVDYYYITSSDKPGAGAKMLDPFRKAGVSFLAVHAFPSGKNRVQVDFVPAKNSAFLRAARGAKLRVSAKKKAFLVQGTDRAGALAGVMAKLGAAAPLSSQCLSVPAPPSPPPHFPARTPQESPESPRRPGLFAGAAFLARMSVKTVDIPSRTSIQGCRGRTSRPPGPAAGGRERIRLG